MGKEMCAFLMLRNARFRPHAMQQIGSLNPDILAVYLADPRGHSDRDLTAIMKGIDKLCKQQFQEGGHYMAFANHAANTWNRADDWGLPDAQATSARDCRLGLVDSESNRPIKTFMKVISDQKLDLGMQLSCGCGLRRMGGRDASRHMQGGRIMHWEVCL